MTESDWVAAVIGVATVSVSAFSVVKAIGGVRDQLWMQMFSEYTRRYSEIMEPIPFDARQSQGAYDLNILLVADRAAILNAMRRYFNLCSEELFLHSKGRIDDQLWEIWRRGIESVTVLSAFRSGWTLLRDEYSQYPEFIDFMDACSGRERSR